jgi:hypothetical protein
MIGTYFAPRNYAACEHVRNRGRKTDEDHHLDGSFLRHCCGITPPRPQEVRAGRKLIERQHCRARRQPAQRAGNPSAGF